MFCGVVLNFLGRIGPGDMVSFDAVRECVGNVGAVGVKGELDVTKFPEAQEEFEAIDVLELELDVRPKNPGHELPSVSTGDFFALESRLMPSIRSARTSVAGLRASGSHFPFRRACHHAFVCLSGAECRSTSARLSSTTLVWFSLRDRALCSVASSSSAAASLTSCCLLLGESRRPQASILKTTRSTSEMYGRWSGDGLISCAGFAALGRKGQSISGVMRTSMACTRPLVGGDDGEGDAGGEVW